VDRYAAVPVISKGSACFRFRLMAAALILAACGAPPETADTVRSVDTNRVPAVTEAAADMSSSEHRALAERFRRTLERLVEEDGLPGAVAAYALPTGRLGVAGEGFADIESGARMGPHHRMLAGSIGKTFVAATVLSVAAQGLVNLDAPVSTYLDEQAFAALSSWERITIRHLLTHSAGLRDHVDDEDFGALVGGLLERGDPDASIDPPALVGTILNDPALFEPGAGYSYTDTGYILLGLVIEEVTGGTYYDELQRRILDPLELEQTSPSERHAPYLATGYLESNNIFGLPERVVEDGAMILNPAVEWTGGGLISNPADLVAWARALYRGEALPTPYLNDLLGSVVKRSPEDTGGYGLGVFINDTELGRTYGHPGWFPGYNSIVAYYPNWDIAVAIQINRDFGNRLGHYRDELARVVMAALSVEAP